MNKNNPEFYQRICKRRTGIGADGVLLVETSENADFKMVYINADGYEAEMCANGARAISFFAFHNLHISKVNKLRFQTMNSVYTSEVDERQVELKMTELSDIGKIEINDFFPSMASLYLNTGVPHCVFEVSELEKLDVETNGRTIRYQDRFKNGTNVNFVKCVEPNKIAVRTYERGVEAETLSCGTGVTAAALAMAKIHGWKNQIEIETAGGHLHVRFNENFEDIFLKGAVDEIYTGSFNT